MYGMYALQESVRQIRDRLRPDCRRQDFGLPWRRRMFAASGIIIMSNEEA